MKLQIIKKALFRSNVIIKIELLSMLLKPFMSQNSLSNPRSKQ